MTLEQLKETRRALNELINQRWIYINSPTTSEDEIENTKKNMSLTYDTLVKVLELIAKEDKI